VLAVYAIFLYILITHIKLLLRIKTQPVVKTPQNNPKSQTFKSAIIRPTFAKAYAKYAKANPYLASIRKFIEVTR
jgi:hypothetical protein